MSGTCPAGKLMILIPAYNEEGAVGDVVRGVREVMPDAEILVVDDCSLDSTLAAAKAAGARVLPLPHHLGLGGAVQAGYKLAYELGFEYVIRVDGDGQHDPRDIRRILDALLTSGCQMVIGSRFLDGSDDYTSPLRSLGISFFRLVLRPILGKDVRDPTSGFVGVNRKALQVFSKSFPLEYP
ncbi:MAG: glycosyltransferase family 2 protein, partial [Bryobacteraceae bacterium]